VIRSIALSFVVLFVSGAWGADLSDRSAHRDSGRSYLNYKNRARALALTPEQGVIATPVASAKKVTSLDQLPPATVWESEKVMVERFKRFRDERFFDDRESSGFLAPVFVALSRRWMLCPRGSRRSQFG
jgi:hypothetical protein